MKKAIVNQILFLLIAAAVLSGIFFLIALLISLKINATLKDTLFIEGIIIVIAGFMLAMQGNPSGLSMLHSGKLDSYSPYVNLEITKKERENTNYFKNFKNNSIVVWSRSSFTIILAGVFMILISVLFY